MSTVSATAPRASSAVSDIARRLRANLQTYALIMATMIIWGFFSSVTNGAYLTPQNFSNLFRQMTVTALLSVGMVLVIVTGNIDLSVGNFAGFISVIVAKLQADVWTQVLPGQEVLTTILSVLVGLAAGIFFGVIQGSIISYLRVPAFIVTLGGMWAFKGALLLVTEGKTIPANQPLFSQIAQGYLPPMAGWVITAAVIVLLFFMMLNGRRKKRQYGFELDSIYWDVAKTTLYSVLVAGYVYIVNLYNGVAIPVLIPRRGRRGDRLCFGRHAIWTLCVRHRRQSRGGPVVRRQYPQQRLYDLCADGVSVRRLGNRSGIVRGVMARSRRGTATSSTRSRRASWAAPPRSAARGRSWAPWSDRSSWRA